MSHWSFVYDTYDPGIRRSDEVNRHLKQDDAFNRTWWSVLSIDKLVTWQHLSIERIGGHVVLKASSCLRCLMLQCCKFLISHPKVLSLQN